MASGDQQQLAVGKTEVSFPSIGTKLQFVPGCVLRFAFRLVAWPH